MLKTSPPSASHGTAVTDHRGELFVTEPFHMQIPCPWVLLIQHSTLALVYTMCTRGLFRTNCPGLFLLLEAPVCRSKLLVRVSATFKGEVLKASLSSNCLSRNFYVCVSRKRSLPFTERGHLSQYRDNSGVISGDGTELFKKIQAQCIFRFFWASLQQHISHILLNLPSFFFLNWLTWLHAAFSYLTCWPRRSHIVWLH